MRRVLGGESGERLSREEAAARGAECTLWPGSVMARLQNQITTSSGVSHDFPFF